MTNAMFLNLKKVGAGFVALSVLSCGTSSKVDSQIAAVPAPFPVVSIQTIAGMQNLKITYMGVTKFYPASNFSAKIMNYPCNNLSLPPVTQQLNGQIISAVKVNTLPGLSTSGHVAVGVIFNYCALVSFSASFILKPNNLGNHVFKLLQVPKARTLTPVPTTPANATFPVDIIRGFAFTSTGKLMMNLANPTDSTGFYYFSLPTNSTQPMGPFQGCVNQVIGEAPIC